MREGEEEGGEKEGEEEENVMMTSSHPYLKVSRQEYHFQSCIPLLPPTAP